MIFRRLLLWWRKSHQSSTMKQTVLRSDIEQNIKLIDFVKQTDRSPVTLIYADLTLNVVDGSSIWLSSVVNIFSEISNVIVLAKESIRRDLITSNFKETIYKRIILEPSDFGLNTHFNNQLASQVLHYIDEMVPTVQNLLIRGTELSIELAKKNNFKDRVLVYLTNFYKPSLNGPIVSDEIKNALPLIKNQAKMWLFQTKEIKNLVEEIIGHNIDNSRIFPPILPAKFLLPSTPNRKLLKKEDELVIGYAGKIQPDWGVLELLEFVANFRTIRKIKLRIITSKIGAGSNFNVNVDNFVNRVKKLLKEDFVELIENVNRDKSLELLSSVDFIWSFRPAYFEENTLELSTKLLEGLSLGIPTICYPNKINKDLLGDEYQYFIKNVDDLDGIFELTQSETFYKTVQSIISDFSFDYRVSSCRDFINDVYSKSMVIAGDDLKFIEHYISYLKACGYPIYKDAWSWGNPENESRSKELYKKADIIFCEWGLANAVWYSKNNTELKPLFVRIHAQEVRERARKFGNSLNVDNITKFIFVSDKIKGDALKLWNWPQEKMTTIPNYVLTNDFTFIHKTKLSPILGIVGITPHSKRLDIAIDLISAMLKIYPEAKLYIKGKRPEEYEWMHALGRVRELDYYYEQYKRLEVEPLKSAVIFDGFDNDMANWYQKIDFILSTSDHESFHYGLADGVLSGCIPIVWPWDGASDIYDKNWIVKDVEGAINMINHHLFATNIKELRLNNSILINSNYGYKKIQNLLKEVVFNV
ncbi:MAG: glycosyltransferase [Burkholderiales bacterium]|nr:glycosyltransferase [Burkholderiales bacterium]